MFHLSHQTIHGVILYLTMWGSDLCREPQKMNETEGSFPRMSPIPARVKPDSSCRWIRYRSTRIAEMLAVAVLAGGCSATHYRNSADKEVYQIIQDVDKRVFGATNIFTIDTLYSRRKPKEIRPAEIIDDRSKTNRRVLNLDQALDLAVEYSREYQTEKEQLYLTALSLTGARYEFGPQFFATSTAQIDGSPSSADVGSVHSQIGVGQLLKTGGRLGLALGNDLVRYFTGKPDLVARDSAINTLSVDLTQPLLRGFGINNPLVEQLTQSERNVVYAVRSVSLFQQQFAVTTVSGYFNLLTQKDIVRNNYQNYTNRVETTKYLEARAVDRERRSSVDDARNAELGAERAYLDSLASYLTSLDAFKLLLAAGSFARILGSAELSLKLYYKFCE